MHRGGQGLVVSSPPPPHTHTPTHWHTDFFHRHMHTSYVHKEYKRGMSRSSDGTIVLPPVRPRPLALAVMVVHKANFKKILLRDKNRAHSLTVSQKHQLEVELKKLESEDFNLKFKLADV